MPNTVTRQVEVTQQDIDQGCALNTDNCPVARAIKRAFPEFNQIAVHEKDILLGFDGWSKNLPNTDEVEAFIRAFDKNETVLPFSFNLTVLI